MHWVEQTARVCHSPLDTTSQGHWSKGLMTAGTELQTSTTSRPPLRVSSLRPRAYIADLHVACTGNPWLH
jgi:hypothetical protein